MVVTLDDLLGRVVCNHVRQLLISRTHEFGMKLHFMLLGGFDINIGWRCLHLFQILAYMGGNESGVEMEILHLLHVSFTRLECCIRMRLQCSSGLLYEVVFAWRDI